LLNIKAGRCTAAWDVREGHIYSQSASHPTSVDGCCMEGLVNYLAARQQS